MDCSLPGSSVHGISQARMLEWVTISFSWGDLPDQEIEPTSPALAGRFFTTEPPGKPETLTERGKINEWHGIGKDKESWRKMINWKRDTLWKQRLLLHISRGFPCRNVGSDFPGFVWGQVNLTHVECPTGMEAVLKDIVKYQNWNLNLNFITLIKSHLSEGESKVEPPVPHGVPLLYPKCKPSGSSPRYSLKDGISNSPEFLKNFPHWFYFLFGYSWFTILG